MPNSPDPQAPDLGFCDRRTCILGLTQQTPRADSRLPSAPERLKVAGSS